MGIETKTSLQKTGLNKKKHIKFSIKILEERCKACGLCIYFCPKNVLDFSEKRNQHGYKVVYPKFPEKCTMCGICFLVCPDVVFVGED